MKPPENVKVYDNPYSIYWYDEDGILNSIYKKVPPQTLEEVKKRIAELKKTMKEEKICMLIDVTHSFETTREVREYVAQEFPKIVKALAMISDTVLGKMLSNLFLSIKAQPYPTKMFNDEKVAKQWLKQYL